MKCPVCSQRKGKRACPAKSAQICPQCCGEKRILEIDCPETCEFLRAGRHREARAHRSRHFHSGDPVQMDRIRHVMADLEDSLAALEVCIADERRASRDLNDRDVQEAVDLLLATLRTEDSGILYERTSSHLRVDAMRRRMKDVVASLRSPKDPAVRRLRLGEAIDCLEVIRGFLKTHLESRPSRMSYVDFLARLLPSRQRIEPAGPSLIIPGR